jgi:general secretion pathway protein D
MTRRKLTRAMILLGSAVAMTFDPGVMVAQRTPPTTAPVTQPTGDAPATAPATTTAAATAPTTSPVAQRPRVNPPTTQITMRFKDAPVDAVLQHLSEAAGFEVVKDAPVEGRVTVWVDQPVSPEEAVTLLNTVLKGNGYTAIQMGRILKITSREKAKKGSIPVRFGADPADIPLTDDLYTQVVPLKSVDAVKLKADLQPLVSTDADLSDNAASNSIIITDTSANIHRVVEIISSLDKREETENDIVVQQLKYADATATAKLITDIFKPADASQSQPQNPFSFFGRGRGRGGPGGPGGNEASADDQDKGHTGTVTASADTRTNTIVVTGPKDTLATIKSEILSKIDANPAEDQKFFTYRVRNGQAVDMAATLNALFGNPTTTTNTNNRSGVSSSTGNRTSSGFTGSNSGGFGGGGGGGGGGGFGGSSGGSNRGGSSSGSSGGLNRTGYGQGSNSNGSGANASGVNSAAASLVGQVQVVADQDTNSLLVVTASKYEDDVHKIIMELDRAVPQVLIKALIAEVTHDRSDDLGLDFSILNLSKNLSGGSNLGNIASGTANGGLVVTLAESQISTTFHALAVAGKLDVLSRPYILTSDNQEANILVGQEVPFITNTRQDALGGLVNTVQYQDIGVILDVTPHINPDGLVVMDVAPQISSQSDQSVQLQAGVSSPVFNQRSASARVAIRDGQTIVIGGLMQDEKTQTITKVPILGDIPYLGLLFQRDNVTKTKTELLIFLTPHVAQAPDHLQGMSVDEMRGVHLLPGAVQPGTFQEQIKGLQLGGSSTQPALPIPKPEYDRDRWEPEPKMP